MSPTTTVFSDSTLRVSHDSTVSNLYNFHGPRLGSVTSKVVRHGRGTMFSKTYHEPFVQTETAGRIKGTVSVEIFDVHPDIGSLVN